MILGKQVQVPPFPPQYLVFGLLLGNLVLYMFSSYQTLCQVFIYVYGMLILNEVDLSSLTFRLTMGLNSVLLITDLIGFELGHIYQVILFILICAVYHEILLKCVVELYKSVTLGQKVTFSQVFIAIQFMTANNFLVGLIGIGRLKHLPIFIRIIQNIKIQSQVALRAIGRFLILILLIEFAHMPILWTILKVAITLWFIFVDFKFAFQMDRVTNHGLYFFPKGVHYAIFGLDLLCRISWIFSPTSAVLIGVIRKLLENYGRLEAQAANNKKNTIFKEIMHIAGLQNIAA